MSKTYENYLVLALFIFIIIMSGLVSIETFSSDTIMVESQIDGKKYIVRNVDNQQESADMLAKLSQRLIRLVEYLKLKYNDDDRVKRLDKKFNPNVLVESSATSKYTSYTINKGDKIVMCIRTKKDNEEIAEENLLTFVALHELSHICTVSKNHTEEFWENFEWVLERSVELGIYRAEDYSKSNKDYCGIKVTDTPLK